MIKTTSKLCMITLAVVLSLVACNNENDEPKRDEVPTPKSEDIAYLLNQGNFYLKIEGSLNVIDFETSEVSNSVFKATNGRVIGDTPQCGVAYGSKLYVGTSESKTIEVIDRATFKSIKQVSLVNSGSGQSPRSMVAADGKIYISMYEGYVARLDTTDYQIDASVKVGTNPDVMCLHNGKLYVPNSEGENYNLNLPYGTTASIVSLNPFKEESVITVPLNPTKFMSDGNNLYLLCMGDYATESSAVYRITTDEAPQMIGAATVAAAGKGRLILGNNPYVTEGSQLSYSIVDGATGQLTEIKLAEAEAPNNIGIDPLTGKIIVSSYDKPAGVFADYISPGWACEYDSDLKFMKKYRIGTGPTTIFFNE